MAKSTVVRTIVVLFLSAMALQAPATVHAASPLPIDPGPEADCLGPVPFPATQLTRKSLRADIVVALDGVSIHRAKQIMRRAAMPYAPGPIPQITPDVRLNVIAYHDLTGKFDSSLVTAGVTGYAPIASDMMSTLIRYYNLNYPNLRRDAIHLLTSQDIGSDLGNGQRNNGILGITDCIGAIGTKYAFSIAEAGVVKQLPIGPFTFYADLDAKVTAHELGHVFGAQHHYAQCGQSATAALDHRPDVCSLMFNDADVIDLHFNPVEVAAIRGFAEAQLKH
jgi:hypothetical protein